MAVAVTVVPSIVPAVAAISAVAAPMTTASVTTAVAVKPRVPPQKKTIKRHTAGMRSLQRNMRDPSKEKRRSAAARKRTAAASLLGVTARVLPRTDYPTLNHSILSRTQVQSGICSLPAVNFPVDRPFIRRNRIALLDPSQRRYYLRDSVNPKARSPRRREFHAAQGLSGPGRRRLFARWMQPAQRQCQVSHRCHPQGADA